MELSMPIMISVPDIILAAILIITVIIGKKRGFISMVSGLISFVGALFCAERFAFILDEFLSRRVFTPWMTSLVEKALNSTNEVSTDALQHSVEAITGTAEKLGIKFEGLTIPDIGEVMTETMQNTVQESIVSPIAEKLSSVTAHVLLFLLAYIILRLILRGISLIFRLPLLKEVNTIVGVVTGVILGLAYMWAGAQLLNVVTGIWCSAGNMPIWMEPGYLMRILTGNMALIHF